MMVGKWTRRAGYSGHPVPSAEEFRSVADILLGGVPADTDISSVGLASPDDHWLVTIRTRTPGRVIRSARSNR